MLFCFLFSDVLLIYHKNKGGNLIFLPDINSMGGSDMKTAKKVLSVLLSAVLALAVCIPAFASGDYDRAKVAQNDESYISSLSAEETAGIILDWLDRKVASVTSDFDNFEIEIFEGTTVEIPLSIDSVEALLQYAPYTAQLGGDFASLDVSALSGLTRKNGDIAFINGLLEFAAANSDVLAKLVEWEDGKTFDLGKVGDYIDSLDDGDSVKIFVNDYIRSGDLKSKITDVIANLLGYTPAEGETLDDIVNNGILNALTSALKDKGLLSDEGVAAVKSNIDLRKLDAYSAVKELVRLVQNDNQTALNTAYTYYLDNLVRPLLKTALGYTRSYGETAQLSALPYSDLAELKKLAGDNEILVKIGDKYYSFVLDESNAVTEAKEVIWTQSVSLEPVTAEISSSAGVIGTYKPMTADIAPVIYTTYADKLTSAEFAPLIAGDTVPEEYASLMTDANKAGEIKDYFAVKAMQGENSLFDVKIEFSDIEKYAEAQASAMALEELKKAFDSAGVKYSDDLAVSVDVTMNYEGWATDDEFIVNVTADAVPAMSGNVTYTVPVLGETTVEINTAIGILKNLGIDVDKMISDEIAKVLVNPVATVVVDNLSGTGDELGGLLELASFLDTDFDIDYSLIDFYANYDSHNGVVGQINDILCGAVKMLTSDEGYASLGLNEGLNDNLTANMQKICDKADSMMSLAKTYLDKNGFEDLIKGFDVDSFFASSHGFNAGMIYDLDFSSVENLYVCGIRIFLDFAAKDEEGTLLYDIHMAVEDLDTLEEMTSAVYDVVFDRINNALTDKFGAKGYAYTFDKTDAKTVNESNAKDVIMTKIADFSLYFATFTFDKLIPSAINSEINALNEKLGSDFPEVTFSFGVSASDSWKDTLTATVDRVYDILDGICIPVTGFEGTLAQKINNLFCSVLPMGSLLSNCKSSEYCCDISLIDSAVFDKALDGNFDSLLRFFETAEKTEDIADGVPFTKAVINAAAHTLDSFLPGTIVSDEYVSGNDLLDKFVSGDNLAKLASAAIKSANNEKTALVPAVLDMIRDFGILPYFCRCNDGEHVFEEFEEVKATCTTEGREAYSKCTVCGKIEGGAVIPADKNNHVNIIEVAEVEPTCTKAGSAAGTRCADCNAVISGCEPIAPKGHTVVTAEGKAPTCTEDGLTDGIKCSECGETIVEQDVIPALGHSYNDEGVCTVCGAQKPVSKNFFQKIVDFFKKIVNWLKNLFK